MTQKFYLHRGTTSDTGTLPAAGTSVSATTPVAIASGGDTNRNMDGTIGGSAQTSQVLTTAANTSAQTDLLLRFCSPPLAAQTISAVIGKGVLMGLAESNLNSNFIAAAVLVAWRPGTGAIVGTRIFDLVAGVEFVEPAAAATQEWQASPTTGGPGVAILDGDILVLELWRNSVVQGMSTSYTNTIFYDGTTEGSATNSAAYLQMGADIALYVAETQTPHVDTLTRQLLAH